VTGWERETVDVGMRQYAVYAVISVCCTRCTLDTVYSVLGVCFTRCMLYLVLTPDFDIV